PEQLTKGEQVPGRVIDDQDLRDRTVELALPLPTRIDLQRLRRGLPHPIFLDQCAAPGYYLFSVRAPLTGRHSDSRRTTRPRGHAAIGRPPKRSPPNNQKKNAPIPTTRW